MDHGEKECIKPRAGDADLWVKNGESCVSWLEEASLVDVAHVKAHRTKNEKEKMTKIERFVTEGHEKADELAKSRSNAGRRFYSRSERCYYEAGERGRVLILAICSEFP